MPLFVLTLMQIYFSVPPVDAPELARRGLYSVGVRTLDLVNPVQADILNFNKETGKAPLYDRQLKVEVWYPAVIPEGEKEHTVYTSPMPGKTPGTFQLVGKSLRDAAPVKGERFPLVVRLSMTTSRSARWSMTWRTSRWKSGSPPPESRTDRSPFAAISSMSSVVRLSGICSLVRRSCWLQK